MAIILIGLIVAWTGYAKRSRVAWVVMFVIVWFWAFPVFILPLVVPLARRDFMRTLPQFFYDAISGSGMTAQLARSILMFFIMVIGLALPLSVRLLTNRVDVPISPFSILVAFAVSFTVGVGFGLLPARRASQLNPTEALRYE